MTKTFTLDEIGYFYLQFDKNWNDWVKNTKLSPRGLYNLIGFKRAIYNKYAQSQETVRSMMETAGAVTNDEGYLVLPDDKKEEVQQEVFKLGQTTTEIEAEPIYLADSDIIDSTLMELIYDFVVFN